MFDAVYKWAEVIHAAVLHNCRGWHVSSHILHRIRTCELKLLRKVLRLEEKDKPTEGKWMYHKKTARLIYHLMAALQISPLHVTRLHPRRMEGKKQHVGRPQPPYRGPYSQRRLMVGLREERAGVQEGQGRNEPTKIDHHPHDADGCNKVPKPPEPCRQIEARAENEVRQNGKRYQDSQSHERDDIEEAQTKKSRKQVRPSKKKKPFPTVTNIL